LLTETDGNDATYFLLHHLRVVRRAIDELQKYLKRKMTEVRRFERQLREADHFNHRQIALLQQAVRERDQRFTFESHRRSHRISFATARADLLDLWDRGLLERRRIGRKYVFFPIDDLDESLTGS
jgi:Fic family protein